MTKRQDGDSIYAKRQFDTKIIVLCVRWYITYRLSYRDLVAMMAERGVLASNNSLIASISINFRSEEVVLVTTDRYEPTGNVPLRENRLAGRKFVGCVCSP